MKFVTCNNGHVVNEFIIEVDGSCHVCRGEKPCPSVSDMQKLDVGDALYFVKGSQNAVSGMASYMKLRYGKMFKTTVGVVERVL